MLDKLYLQIGPAPTAIVSVSIMLSAGFLLSKITSRLRLPNVTAYIAAGILIGPFCFDLIPQDIISGTSFLPDIALAFIAFSVGEFFEFKTLKKNGAKMIVITLFESLAASVLVFILTFFILRLDIAFSVVLSSLAAATAPASTLMTIRQTGAKGPFVDTVLQVVAMDDVVALAAYSAAVSIAAASAAEGFSTAGIATPLVLNMLMLALGAASGLILKYAISKSSSNDNRLIVSVSFLLAFCGVCAMLDISPLLGCMAMGMVYRNVSQDDKLFKQLNYFSPPILLIFFVRSGVSFDLNALLKPSGSIGAVPLIFVGLLYFIVRISGKYIGAFSGCAVVKAEKRIRNYLGLALIPQAGVAIGLAALGARTIGGETGSALLTIIMASSVLYELVGPACAKLSLYLSHSYSNNIDEIPLNMDEAENEVERLIKRISVIRSQLPESKTDPAEMAFTEAAEAFNTKMFRRPNIKNKVK